jgi:hypothetical protein
VGVRSAWVSFYNVLLFILGKDVCRSIDRWAIDRWAAIDGWVMGDGWMDGSESC